MKYLLIDDHPLMRQGLAVVLRQGSQAAQVLEAGDGAAGLALAQVHPDIACALVDLKMQGMDGLATVAALHALRPGLPVVVVSSSEEPGDVRRTMRAGARGYCPKSAPGPEILEALQTAMAGRIYVPPQLRHALDSPAPPGEDALTERQLDVLRLLCKGHPNKLIGRELDMQEKTVKGHVTAIFRALGVVNRTQAVEAARKIGITA
jgi:two-component system, NarL family, nitrate/nitrite response regulator NarL